jgi:N-methylhydantoinase A/oxoprolinase/acetone carboxylase beta subunit
MTAGRRRSARTSTTFTSGNTRAASTSRTSRSPTSEVERSGDSPDAALRHEGKAWFRVDGELWQVDTRYYDRAALKADNRLDGPAIVNQYDTTTVIPPGLAAQVDRFGNIVIEVGASAEAQALAAGMEFSG